MKPHMHGQLDIYKELFPASAATIIGAGFVTSTMGAAPSMGISIVLAGIAVGIASPIACSFRDRKNTKKRKR